MKKDKQKNNHPLPNGSRLPVATDQNQFASKNISVYHDRTDPQLHLQAQQFALAILADPILKDLYTKMAGNRCTAYSLALSEYLALREEGRWIF